MATFACIVATTAATTITTGGNGSAPYGVTVKSHPSNAADAIIRICNAAVSTSIVTQGFPLKTNDSTVIPPYACLNSNQTPDVGMLWIYASTTGQTVAVQY